MRSLATIAVDDPVEQDAFLLGRAKRGDSKDSKTGKTEQKLTQPGVLRGLARSGGIRADIVGGGTIRTGDAIREVPDRAPAEAT